ncbi:RNA-Hypothetical protein protein [Nesidiocoris tenuis]|uniref:RRM domain-containing protein n=1 Tax=Nesidiocoris tenuis TaxID=355587 RepID=A0ABN7BEU1_9HEMI|nr:RNA-Hypothetical protein protein [Nesidiocoris tenuis]
MAICGLYVVTSGLLGTNLGSDEHEIVLLGYSVIDLATNQVLGLQEYVVQPTNCDINHSSYILSDDVKQETRLTEAAIRTSGIPLQKALALFENYCRSLCVDPSSLTFVTDGQCPLRQCLHPEATSKEIELPSQYYRFCDLRKDVARYYGAGDSKFTSLQEIMTFLDIPESGDASFFGKEFKDMVNILQRMIQDGYKFKIVEAVQSQLEPGICSRYEEVDSNCVVRARGLPWQSSDQDIAKFFSGLNISKGGVALCLSPGGRRNGEALVRFTSPEHRDMALKRHKHHIGQRYIEVYRATGEDYVNVAGGSSNEAQAFLTRGAKVIIRMRGLPYDCTAKQIIEFFETGEQSCQVMDGEEGLLFVRKPCGRSTGDAFVLFKEELDASKALSRHRKTIGTRYIELFRSTTAEVQQVLNRTLETTTETPTTILPPPLTVPLLPQHIITSGTRKDCIRLRGLPYEAQVEHILEFLGDHAKSIVFQGVHMVYNSQGQPSGEAFIQMDSETSAQQAAQQRHHRNMTFGKKQRYIEVFQCSGEDMNIVLSGGLAQPAQLSPVTPLPAPTKPMLSPGINHGLIDLQLGQMPQPNGQIPIMSQMMGQIPMTCPPVYQMQQMQQMQPNYHHLVDPMLMLPKVMLPLKRSWNEAFTHPPPAVYPNPGQIGLNGQISGQLANQIAQAQAHAAQYMPQPQAKRIHLQPTIQQLQQIGSMQHPAMVTRFYPSM